MRAPRSLEQEFLKKWMTGIRASKLPKKEMNLLERKSAIKLTADLAMASTKNGTTSWSCAVIADAAKDDHNKTLINSLLDSEGSKRVTRFQIRTTMSIKRVRSKKVLRRSFNNHRRVFEAKKVAKASCIAKQMVKKRTKILKRLVPGGEEMDECAFVDEAIDYIVSLRAQVDVMRSLANASEVLVLNNRK